MKPYHIVGAAVLAGLIAAPVCAAAFDPEAATQAYLATLNGAARAKSDAYFEGGYWLILWGALAALASDAIILNFGLSRRFRDWAERVTKRRWLQPGLYVLPYIAVGTLITLPWTIYTGFFRERQYDLMNQSFGAWAGEQATGLAVGVVLTPLLVIALWAGIRNSPKRWWLWGAAGLTLFTAIGALVAPVFLSPLFNTYTELKPGPLRDRIVAMAKSRDIPADHIYVYDASKQTKKISANVSGLGPTTRISLNDNLLNRTGPDEVVSVLGHEMGHYKLNHVPRAIGIFAFIFLVAFYLLYRLVPLIIARYGARWGVRGADDPAALPIFGILLTLFFLVITPVTNTMTRVQEVEADAFGLDAAHQPDAAAKVFMMLSEYRKIAPGPVEEMLFFDHPSGHNRVRMAMDWKAAHLAEVEAKAK